MNTFKRISGNVAERIDLEIRKGNTLNFDFIFTQTNGTALDLTNYTEINFAVLNGQSSEVITADTSTGLTISGTGNNVLSLVKDEADTNITAGNGYSYRLTLTKASYVRQVLNGYFVITDKITDVTEHRDNEGVTTVYIEGNYYTVTVINAE